MVLTNLFQFDGKPIVPPDCDMQMRFEDLDSAQSGRDEAGYMHRIVVRRKVGVWDFSYNRLSGEEYRYMMSALPKSGSFLFTHPSPEDSRETETTQAYISGYSAAWYSAQTDSYRNLTFSVIQC